MCRDPGSGVHGDPGNLPVDELALSGVQSRTDVDAQLVHGVDDRLGVALGHRV